MLVDRVTNPCLSRDMTKRGSLSEEEYQLSQLFLSFSLFESLYSSFKQILIYLYDRHIIRKILLIFVILSTILKSLTNLESEIELELKSKIREIRVSFLERFCRISRMMQKSRTATYSNLRANKSSFIFVKQSKTENSQHELSIYINIMKKLQF